MNKEIDCQLAGAFRVKLLKDGNLVSDTDYFSNFITQTGLFYPLTYSFADCFRYLSLGRSSVANSGSQSLSILGTTGLNNPITSFVSSIGSQNAQYIGWPGYATGETNSNCGTVLSETGPRLYKAWFVPTGAGDVTINEPGGGLTISEFMVSPSSGTDPVGSSAFSRVVRNIFIPNGYRAIISYQLKILVGNTGITYFSGGSFQTGNAEVSNDSDLVQGWANLSGYFRQVYHGLRCIDNLGFTYIPKLGDGMEPSSTNTRKMTWYLSPDNSQFDVSVSGSNQSSTSRAYSADGLMASIKTVDLSNVIANPGFDGLDYDSLNDLYNTNSPVTLDTIPEETTLTNIRIGSTNSPLMLPQIDNYQIIDDNSSNFTYQLKQTDIDTRTISYATPGQIGFDSNAADFGKKAAFTNSTTKLPFLTGGQNSITGRKKTITRSSVFSPISALGRNTRFGSMVYAFESQQSASDGNSLYYPVIDTLFFDSSGNSMMPHYRLISGIYLSDRGTGVLDANLFLSGQIGNNIFQFNTRRTFQGPGNPIAHYLTGAEIPSDLDGTYIPFYSGFLANGSFNSSAIGQTGGITIGNTFFSGGYGCVYGVLANNSFYSLPLDLGIIPHNIRTLGEPSNTGQLYWPVVSNNNTINLYATGVKFWAPELRTLIISDNSGWYNSNRQIIKDCNFDLQDTAFNVLPPKNITKNVTGAAINLVSGYYITNTRYFNNIISLSDIVNNGSYTFNGYIVPNDRNTNGQFKGGVWSGTLPTDNLILTPKITSTILSGLNSAQKVTGLFVTEAERGYTNGTGGTPIKANDSMLLFFTGFSGANPLYLTMVSGSGLTSLMGFSYLSGNVTTTNFSTPTGYPLHIENSGDYGSRLKPLSALANYYGPDLYSVNSNGSYPGLSQDNSLIVYLSISYSSPCGPSTVNCSEPI